MSDNAIVEVVRIDNVENLKNSDRLDICHIKGWQVVTSRNQFKTGDKVVLVPPDYILPQALVDELDIGTYLKSGNRTKSIKLRGEPSFGLALVPSQKDWPVGTDVAKFYGIT